MTIGVYRSNTKARKNNAAEIALLQDLADVCTAGGGEITIVSDFERAKFIKNAYSGVIAVSSAVLRLSPIDWFRRPESEAFDANGQWVDLPSAVPGVPCASPSIGKYTIPALYSALDELQTLGNVLFSPVEDDPSSDFRTDLATFMLKLSSSVASGPNPSTHDPSIMVDRENGRPMEIENIVGEVVRMAQKLGVPVPVRFLCHLRCFPY